MIRRAKITRHAWVPPALLCSLALGACGRSQGIADQDLGELVIAARPAATAIDVGRAATEPAELGRALMRPYTATIEVLGPHTLDIATTTSVEEAGKPADDRTEHTLLELGPVGAFHARYENSADYGREAIFHEGTLFLRPRYQRWHGRAPETADEPATLRDEYAAPMAATWDLVGFAAQLADQGAAPVAGRAGRKIAVSLAARPATPEPEGPTQRKWREGRRVEALTGEIIIDAERGVPLAVKLAGTIAFSRDGRQFKLKVTVESAVGRLGPTPIAPPAPAEVVATPERLREVDDRDTLLDGMAPPIRKRPEGSVATPPPAAKPADATTPPPDAGTDEPKKKRKKRDDSETSEKSEKSENKPETQPDTTEKSQPAAPEKEPTP